MALLSSAILVLLLAWLAVRLLWLLLAGPEVSAVAMPPVPQIQPAASARDGFRWDLFGQAPPAVPVIAAPLATASGSLRLRGLMSGGADGFAIIADGQGRERVYRVGDELPDGSRLSEIETLQVVIAREGRREALSLERDQAGRGDAGRGRADAQAVTPLPGIRGFQAPAGISAASLQSPEPAATGLAEQISVMPVAGGGFRVRPGRDATLFAELGLQVNDVVTAVNGQPLSSEEDARALFAEVLRSGEVSITINRQGREMTLRPNLEQILSRL